VYAKWHHRLFHSHCRRHRFFDWTWNRVVGRDGRWPCQSRMAVVFRLTPWHGLSKDPNTRFVFWRSYPLAWGRTAPAYSSISAYAEVACRDCGADFVGLFFVRRSMICLLGFGRLKKYEHLDQKADAFHHYYSTELSPIQLSLFPDLCPTCKSQSPPIPQHTL
jgi:hypothetical protein